MSLFARCAPPAIVFAGISLPPAIAQSEARNPDPQVARLQLAADPPMIANAIIGRYDLANLTDKQRGDAIAEARREMNVLLLPPEKLQRESEAINRLEKMLSGWFFEFSSRDRKNACLAFFREFSDEPILQEALVQGLSEGNSGHSYIAGADKCVLRTVTEIARVPSPFLDKATRLRIAKSLLEECFEPNRRVSIGRPHDFSAAVAHSMQSGEYVRVVRQLIDGRSKLWGGLQLEFDVRQHKPDLLTARYIFQMAATDFLKRRSTSSSTECYPVEACAELFGHAHNRNVRVSYVRSSEIFRRRDDEEEMAAISPPAILGFRGKAGKLQAVYGVYKGTDGSDASVFDVRPENDSALVESGCIELSAFDRSPNGVRGCGTIPRKDLLDSALYALMLEGTPARGTTPAIMIPSTNREPNPLLGSEQFAIGAGLFCLLWKRRKR